MTTVAILQPGYLPWLGFFDQMRQADIFVYYDDVQFDKHGWRNRNRLKGMQGPVWITVPIIHKGKSRQLIKDVEIVASQRWATKHARSISQLYAKAPFCKTYLPPLSDVLSREWTHLVNLNYAVIDLMQGWFRIDTKTVCASTLGLDGNQTGRLVNICMHLGATEYLSGLAAKDYLDVAQFERVGIKVRWHEYAPPTYTQLHGNFVSHLSALDLVLNCGPDKFWKSNP